MAEQRNVEPSVKEVRALPELIASQLADGEEVERFSARRATALGDNYGSTALALDIVIRNKKANGDARRHLHAFCKMLPDDPVRRAVFNVNVTFVKELQMYTLVIPAMAQLQRDCGVPEEELVVNLVPGCYGGRCNLQGGDAVDDDAAIVLEDMRQRGFGMGDRVAGLDLEHARLVLEKLAVFHALGVALRVKRPQVYEETVLRACCDFRMGEGMDSSAEDSAKLMDCILHNVDKSPAAAPYRHAVRSACLEAGCGPTERHPAVREPFSSVYHCDLWTNNLLLQQDKDGAPKAVALIDFQVSRINSPFKDVIFFLFTSVTTELIESRLDELVEAYHRSFCRCLSQVGVDTAPFSLAAAWAEIDDLARTELFHTLSMLRFILADPAMIRDNPETFAYMPELGGENYARKAEHVVLQFAKRGWIESESAP